MQNDQRSLGSLVSVYRASTAKIWLLGLTVIGLSFIFVLGIAVIINESTNPSAQPDGGALNRFFGPGICLGGSGLLAAIILKILIGEFRKGSGSRTAKLSIYENGFTYESDGKSESCRWDEIKDTTFSIIETSSKAQPRRRVNVIRSIIRSDNTFITLSEKLDLISISQVIRTARKAH